MRLARPEDMDEIARLLPSLAGPSFADRFPGKTAADFCSWKYFANPIGDAAVGVALDRGRVVSLAAAVPKRIQVGNEIVPAVELGDFITDPEYRKRGYFSALIELVCREAAERGAAFAYVRPNSVSFPILERSLGFYEAQKIDHRRYVVPSDVLHRKTGLPSGLFRLMGIDWLSRKIFLPTSGSVEVSPVTRFGQDADAFWERARPHYPFSLVRDSRYLNWRYADCPAPYSFWIARRAGETTGYIVTFSGATEGTAHIVDLLAQPGDAESVSALLCAGVQSALDSGIQVIETWTLQSGAESVGSHILRRACPLVYKPHLHVAVRFLGRMSAADLPSAGWQLTSGDFDGV
jgi:GNAT superfamily N-acetyltransferase